LGIAFDGANIWIANRNDATVSKLLASDGTVLGTFPAPGGPYGVAFDGTYVWVSGDLYLRILRASDGVQIASHQIQTEGVAFDGAFVWTVAQSSNLLYKF
jgi:DNA-binding beta-propeller fold protein YncE